MGFFYEPEPQEMYDGEFPLPRKDETEHGGKFISTIDTELFFNTSKGAWDIKPKEYPCWYGIEDIGFKFVNMYADPLIEYKGKQFSCFYVEDAMWSWFQEDCPHGTEKEFEQYMRDHKADVYELCENIVNYTEEEAV